MEEIITICTTRHPNWPPKQLIKMPDWLVWWEDNQITWAGVIRNESQHGAENSTDTIRQYMGVTWVSEKEDDREAGKRWKDAGDCKWLIKVRGGLYAWDLWQWAAEVLQHLAHKGNSSPLIHQYSSGPFSVRVSTINWLIQHLLMLFSKNTHKDLKRTTQSNSWEDRRLPRSYMNAQTYNTQLNDGRKDDRGDSEMNDLHKIEVTEQKKGRLANSGWDIKPLK